MSRERETRTPQRILWANECLRTPSTVLVLYGILILEVLTTVNYPARVHRLAMSIPRISPLRSLAMFPINLRGCAMKQWEYIFQ